LVRLSVASAASTVHNLRIGLSRGYFRRTVSEWPHQISTQSRSRSISQPMALAYHLPK
jgi:hypothetical protein